jgi:hypothetical protein
VGTVARGRVRGVANAFDRAYNASVVIRERPFGAGPHWD